VLKVEITYAGLIRTALRRNGERLDTPRGTTLGQLLDQIVLRHGPGTRRFLLDETDGLLPHAIVIVDGVAVRDRAARIGRTDSQVRILVLSPMMIGG